MGGGQLNSPTSTGTEPGPENLREALISGASSFGIHYLMKVFFTKRDASLYIAPASTGSPFFFGKQEFPASARSITWHYREGQRSSIAPKLSWHQSGLVRITAGALVSESIRRVALPELSGQHIASVSIADFTHFSAYPKCPNKTQRCFELPIPPGDDTLTFSIYAAHDAQYLPAESTITFSLLRSTCSTAMYFGVRVRYGGFPFEGPSALLVSGWDPLSRADNLEAMDFLYCVSA